MTKTSITTNEGKTIEHTGTGGVTLTFTKTGEDVRVRMEWDIATREEAITGIGGFLAQLAKLHGEDFVTECFCCYASAMDTLRIREEEE